MPIARNDQRIYNSYHYSTSGTTAHLRCIWHISTPTSPRLEEYIYSSSGEIYTARAARRACGWASRGRIDPLCW
eukprot:724218-Pyramimonas_sp.AAC.3